MSLSRVLDFEANPRPAHERTLEALRYWINFEEWPVDVSMESLLLTELMSRIVGVRLPDRDSWENESIPHAMIRALEDLHMRCTADQTSDMVERTILWVMCTYKIDIDVRSKHPIVLALEELHALRLRLPVIGARIDLGYHQAGTTHSRFFLDREGLQEQGYSAVSSFWSGRPCLVRKVSPWLIGRYGLTLDQLRGEIDQLRALPEIPDSSVPDQTS